MAEQIEMHFWLWTRVDPRKRVLYGVHINYHTVLDRFRDITSVDECL